jgi:hypothetical protein
MRCIDSTGNCRQLNTSRSCPAQFHESRSIKSELLLPLLLFAALGAAFPANVSAQLLNRVEVGGGWAHSTGNFGTDGFNFAGAFRFAPKVSVGADYDTLWDNSRIGTFEITQIGAVTSKSHLQNLLFGPRIFFSTAQIAKYKFIPFGEAQFGLSHINSKIESVSIPSVESSDTAFSWLLGGGGDYRFNSRWSGRFRLGFLRTHFAEVGQSRLRFSVGVAYAFGGTE